MIAHEVGRLNKSNSDHYYRVHFLWYFARQDRGFRSLAVVQSTFPQLVSYLICEYRQAHDHHWSNHSGDCGSLLVLVPRLSDECLVPDSWGARESCYQDKGEPDRCGEQDVQEGPDDRGSERSKDLAVRPIHYSRRRPQFTPEPTHYHRYFLRMDPPSNHLIWVRRWCDRDHRHIRRSSGSCLEFHHHTFRLTVS